ncbi:MalY/PatB family protein [Sporolactobacillus vineae]|uniref:MalY/PatB family protein n=1 Tax=Sporolactobacillus vineae TaxID=444463 RepID=UPI000288FEC4|nr:MalY/PatB family protein [Sporolactobacillus vineae]
MDTDGFDRLENRKGTASEKWDAADKLFHGHDLLPMWVADMDFQVPQEVTAALERRIRHGIYGYTFRTESYFDAVRAWMKEHHDWTVRKEWICHSPGVVTALNLLVDGLTQPGDKVLIQPPVYPLFRRSVSHQSRELVTNPLIYENGSYHMDFSDLEVKLADPKVRMMILCSPHNPVGRVWTLDELTAVARLAEKYHVLVVSDEIHGDLTYGAHHQIPFAGLSAYTASHSVVCTAPSKTFNLAGLQISNIIIPDPQLRRIYLRQLGRFSLGSPNTLGVTAAEAAYRYGSSWLKACLGYIGGNADTVRSYIDNDLPELSLVPLEGTYLAWIDCRRLGLDKNELREFMTDQAKLAVNPGDTFGKEGDGFIRLNLACPHSLVLQAMGRLRKAVRAR